MNSAEATHIASAILSKHSFADPYAIPTGPTAHLNPFYPVLLAGIMRVFGAGYLGAIARCVVLICGYAFLYALLPSLAARFGLPRAAGVISGFAAALLPVKRSAEVFLGWDEPFIGLALAALMLVFASEEQRARRAVIWGLVIGLALYISASLASVVAAFALVRISYDFSRRTIRDLVVAAVISLAIMSPWLIRDRLVLGHWVFMRDNLGLELRFSNHDGASATAESMLQRGEYRRLHPDFSRSEAELVREMGEWAYEKREMNLATTWISTHPQDFLTLTGEHFLLFWFGPPEYALEFLLTAAYTLLGFWGLRLLRRRSGQLVFRLWCAALISYPLVYYLVQYYNRYPVPIAWMLWLPAGLLTLHMWERLEKRSQAVRESTFSALSSPEERQPAFKISKH